MPTHEHNPFNLLAGPDCRKPAYRPGVSKMMSMACADQTPVRCAHTSCETCISN
jgi:hypothetical protein